MKSFINGFLREEEGQDLVEYSLLIALVALGAIVGLNTLKNNVATMMNSVGTKLNGTATTPN